MEDGRCRRCGCEGKGAAEAVGGEEEEEDEE